MSQLPAFSGASPPAGNAVITLIASARELPRRDRNAMLSFLDFWRDLPREERALFVKSVRPDLTDEEIARLCGVSRRTLYRWDRFRRFKTRASDFRGHKHAGHASRDADA